MDYRHYEFRGYDTTPFGPLTAEGEKSMIFEAKPTYTGKRKQVSVRESDFFAKMTRLSSKTNRTPRESQELKEMQETFQQIMKRDNPRNIQVIE